MDIENRALLIYSAEDIKRNKWFTDRLTEKAACYGTELKLITSDECRDEYMVENGLWDNKPAFIINRSREADISEWFENKGIRSFNNSETIRTGNDKYAEYELFESMKLPVMETVTGGSAPESIPFEAPYIIKKRNGHGGSDVFKLETKDALGTFLVDKDPSLYIIQKMSDEPGVDMRLYLLGGKVIASVIRTSGKDFRSNYSLGGKAETTEVPEDIRTASEAIARGLSADYIAIDLIRDNGGWVYNEIEDAAGARMLYELTDIDIASDFIHYIFEST